MKKGFTLIELLAVIIVLAVIALIATPTVLKVVDTAKESGRKSSVIGYAEAVKLAIDEQMFKNGGSTTVIDEEFLNNITYQGNRVTCDEVKNTNNYGVILKECTVASNDNLYCFAKGKVYSCDNEEFTDIYDNTDGNKETSTKVYNDTKGVNTPQLTEGMTPIKWDGTTEVTTTSDDSDWYDYSNKKWANAKTADGSYWVWIPRYAYKITSGWHTKTAGTIDIIFLKNDTEKSISNEKIYSNKYKYNIDGTNTSNNYFLHPAFQIETGNTKYGFWVAKFEMSNTTSLPKSVPNVASLTNITVGDMFTYSQKMVSNDSYGWSNFSVDTHMMTNYEWGAVAYLTQSIYGKNSEVWINNSSTLTTGCAGNSVSEAFFSGCQNAYNTIKGVNASTTGNITGVYDMSGGAEEYVSAYLNNTDSILTINGYGNSIINATSNKNVYNIGYKAESVKNYESNVNLYGDAIYETSGSGNGIDSWNSDYAYMPNSGGPWFKRGGYCNNNSSAGMFYFSGTLGNASGIVSFRLIVSPNK